MSFLKNLIKRGNKQEKRLTPMVSSIYETENKTPEYTKANTLDTFMKMYQQEPFIRGGVNVTIDSTVGSGYSLKTFKERDVEIENKRIDRVKKDFQKPRNKFISEVRSWLLNLLIFDLAVFETGEAAKGHFLASLDARYCKFIMSDDKTKISGLKYQTPSMPEPKVLNRKQFVFDSMNRIGSHLYGNSDLEALVDDANLISFARKWNEKQFTSGGVSSLALILKSGSIEDFNFVLQMIKKNTGRHLLLKGDIEIEKLSNMTKDMEFSDLISASQQAIMTVLRVPPIMMAMSAGAQGETDKQMMNAFASRINAVQQILTNTLADAILNMYGADYKDVYIQFKPWTDARLKSAILKVYTTAGIYTINDARRELDMPDVPYGDKPFVANYLPQILGEAPWDTTETNDDYGNDPSANSGNQDTEKPEGQDRDSID